MKNLKRICFLILLLTLCQSLIAQADSTLVSRTSADDFAQTPGCIPPTASPWIFCNGSTTTSTSFDFNNAGQSQFHYSYTIDGGAPITGTFNSPSNYTVNGLLPGQVVAFTLTWVGICGDNVKTMTCSASCVTTTTPNFPAIAPLCAGSTAPVLSNTSPNGVAGTWSPATISNTASGSYVFTPTSGCASPQTINVTVLPKVTPTFNALAPVCQNSPAPVLPQVSTNVPPITGTWSPAVSTASVGTRSYTFTPDPGQCTSATPVTLSLTVLGNSTPGFAPIAPFCAGTTPPVLSAVSPSGVTGSWSPAVVSSSVSGTYTFTPDPGQCASTQILTTTVTPSPQPQFDIIAPFCAGTLAPVLPTVSNDGISGSWWPAVVNNTADGAYVFTPDAGQCASSKTIQIEVIQPIDPGFSDISICSGESIPTLPSISPNGIAGTWAPPVIDGDLDGTHVFTPNEGECAAQQSIQVVINQSAPITIDWTVTDAFDENQTITVLTSGNGNYLYQLDYGPVTANPIFENVAPGSHFITVYDANDCSPPVTVSDILVINYPHFFTPNADGINDFWRVGGLDAASQIFIFDRYGRLLKHLGTQSEGWDGTFLGTPMPSSDYWFSIKYYERNQLKEFTSHFSLKR